jgi:hypothetical protein
MDKVRENLKLVMCVFCFVVFAWLVQVADHYSKVTRYNYIEVETVLLRVDRLTSEVDRHTSKGWRSTVKVTPISEIEQKLNKHK